MTNSECQDLLFEIGTEEIPARFIKGVIEQLENFVDNDFAAKGLTFNNRAIYATPRRLAIYIEGLITAQPDAIIEVKGPSVTAAYDQDGKMTKALQGFCRSQGVTEADLTQREVGGNTYIFAAKTHLGEASIHVLPQLLQDIVRKLNFPKPMRWAEEEMRFVRPIRWIVALFGADILPIEIAHVTASNITRGHRVLGSDHIVLNNPGEYVEKLQANYVLVKQEERRLLIWQQIQAVAQQLGGIVEKDEELLEEVVYLVEYPTALAGSFDIKYLELPKELVITPMREHQRYFPVYRSDGGLLPKFITVRNGDTVGLDVVAAGNERVLRARLADAEFFWQEDSKRVLEDDVQELQTVVFHEKLGTVYDKIGRVQQLAAWIGEELGLDERNLARLDRAVYLMKGDLVSHVVCEFPELQGIMGEYYALGDGEDKIVAQAIREHYLPRFAGDVLPQTNIGQIASIADKVDSLMSFFAMGMIPTGSQDPYALRRQATGITQIILKNKMHLSLTKMLAESYEIIAQKIQLSQVRRDSVISAIGFFRQRMENIFTESGFSYDIINATLLAGIDDLCAVRLKAKAIQACRSESSFGEILMGFTRAANLIRSISEDDKAKIQKLPIGRVLKQMEEANWPIKEELFMEQAEKDLYAEVCKLEVEVKQLTDKNDYVAALLKIVTLRSFIDNYFSNVMIMTDDIEIRNNRLALLRKVVSLIVNVGDLSQIVNH